MKGYSKNNFRKSFNKTRTVKESALSKAISKIYKKYANGFDRPSLLLNLEARMMFDGAAPAVADEIIENVNDQSPESLPAPSAESSQSNSAEAETTSTSTTESSSESSDDVDGIADSLEIGVDATVSELITAEEVNDALELDGADSTATPLFGPNAAQIDATPTTAITATTVSAAVETSADEQESVAEDENENETSTETVADTAENDIEEAIVEEPEVNRVVFIDTSVAGYEDLLDGVIQEIELVAEDDATPVDLSAVVATESSDADTANLSTAPPENDEVSVSPLASNDSGADAALEDSGYTANADGAIIIDGVAIYLLDPADNQVEEITNTLAGFSDLDAIDIISHGAAGEFQLGNQRVNSETLEGYADQIAQWGDALAENGDILLHGCDVADGDSIEFLEEFAELTDADVAASNDDTGNAQFGGDFELEVSTGSIEAVALLTAETASAFVGVLAVDHDSDDDGILNFIDDDDDNDGILDIDEGNGIQFGALDFAFFDDVPAGFTVDNIDDLPLTSTGQVNDFDVDALAIANTPIGSPDGPLDTFGIIYTGVFNASTAGTFTFETLSDDGSALFIDGVEIVDNDGLHGVVSATGSVTLSAGLHDIEIRFFENFGGESLAVNVAEPGGVSQPISFADLGAVTTIDTDGDGIADSRDLDSDNDGISDLFESGIDVGLDSDNDGRIDAANFIDLDNDGVSDQVDQFVNLTTSDSAVPVGGGIATFTANTVNLSSLPNVNIGDTVSITGIFAAGDLNTAPETIDLTFNAGGPTEVVASGLNTGFQDTVVRPVVQAFPPTVTLIDVGGGDPGFIITGASTCLLYTSPSPRDKRQSRMPSSA